MVLNSKKEVRRKGTSVFSRSCCMQIYVFDTKRQAWSVCLRTEKEASEYSQHLFFGDEVVQGVAGGGHHEAAHDVFRLAGVVVVGQKGFVQLLAGDDFCPQLGKLFEGDFLALAHEEDAPGDGVAAVVMGEVEAGDEGGIFQHGQLQVDDFQGELQAFLLVEQQVADLAGREDACADVVFA